jgi:hypothetical protein
VVLSAKLLLMGGPAALMVFTITMEILGVQVVSLSWALLAAALT